VAALVDKAHRRARDILEKERAVLEKAAKILLEKEVLEGEELRELLNSHGQEQKRKQSA
jgi:cell division protease FtsH